jgi:hypothetical protein
MMQRVLKTLHLLTQPSPTTYVWNCLGNAAFMVTKTMVEERTYNSTIVPAASGQS